MRESAGLTQTELCARLGMSSPQLSAYENGHNCPTVETLQRFIDATGITLTFAPNPLPLDPSHISE